MRRLLFAPEEEMKTKLRNRIRNRGRGERRWKATSWTISRIATYTHATHQGCQAMVQVEVYKHILTIPPMRSFIIENMSINPPP